jgi:HEAT repeat protein
MIVVTAAACWAALLLRTPLRSRWWAARVIETSDLNERAACLTALCNAGDDGRWGTSALLDHPDSAVRAAGVVVLQHVRSDWSGRRLLAALEDVDANVREMAAIGLAIHGDESVIPRLARMFREGNPGAARAACIALEELATPTAAACLSELAAIDAAEVDADRRAMLVDALAGIGTPACVPPLVAMLDDHRTSPLPTRAEQLGRRALAAAMLERPDLAVAAASQPVAGGRTIAERAAEALARITGIEASFSSEASGEERADAVRAWTDWGP